MSIDYQDRLSGGVTEDKDGQLIAIGAQLKLGSYGPLIKLLANIDLRQVVIDYPPIRKKDIIAARGALYRASEPHPKPLNQFAMSLVPDNEAPAGTTVQWDSLIVAMRNGYDQKVEHPGRTEIHDHYIYFNKVEMPMAKNPKEAEAIVACLEIRGTGVNFQDVMTAKVKAGDILLLRKSGHKVRKVVPPDAKTQVIGWLELEFKPIPEADLIKDKIPFIRPEK